MTYRFGGIVSDSLKQKIARLAADPAFDAVWYSEQYPEVAYLGISPEEHFLRFGSRLNRQPNDNLAAKDASRLSAVGQPRSSEARVRNVRRRSDNWDYDLERDLQNDIEAIYHRNKQSLGRLKASIIMPSFNRAGSIEKAIQSVIGQTFQNWQLLIVDDGSSDNTLDVLKRFESDKRIEVHPLAHSGVSAARNVGLREADGDIIFFLDTDNIWTPNHLLNALTLMVAGELDVLYSGLEMIDDHGNTRGYRGDFFDWNACLEQNYIDMNCLAHKRLDINKYRFDDSLARLVDWDYILRITLSARVCFAPYISVKYYDGTRGSRITSTRFLGEKVKEIERVVRDKHTSSRWNSELNIPIEDVLWLSRSLSDGPQASHQNIAHWSQASGDNLKKDTVSIVVLNYKNAEMTIDCVNSIIKCESTYNYQYEIVIVDNGSDDGSSDRFLEIFRENAAVRVVSLRENTMFSTGNNVGIANCRGEYCIALNNDTLVTAGWLNPLVDVLRLDPTVGFTGPKLLYEDDTLQCGGLVFSDRSKVPYHVYKGRPSLSPEVNRSRPFQALTGACLAARTIDWIELKGFDFNYINGCEDLDICFRMRERLGKQSWYIPTSTVYHLESKTPGRGKHIMQNRERFVRDWGENVEADDARIYRADNLLAGEYIKRGAEPDGPTASYEPSALNAVHPMERHQINVAFSTIWHARGISIHTHQLAMALEAHDRIQTHVFARWESEKFRNAGPVYHPRVFNAGDDPSPQDTVAWAKANDIDVFFFMEVHPKDWKRVRALKENGITVICYENLDVMRNDTLENYVIFDFFFYNCFYTRRRITKDYPKKPGILIPWGAKPNSDTIQSKARNGRVDFVHVAGWGGVNNRKNTDLLIRAYKKASPSNSRLHVYTQSPLMNYGPDIVAICKSSRDIIVHEGTVDDIGIAYENKSMLLWPSKREGVGLPIIESLMSGLPVLISDGYMMREWIVEGQHGLVVDAKPHIGNRYLPEMVVDEDALAATISRICADPSIIDRMRRNIERDMHHWSWDWQKDVFQQVIIEIASNPNFIPQSIVDYLPKEILEFEATRQNAREGLH